MKKGSSVLFWSRLLLYLFAVSLPLFHPAVAVSYDFPALVLMFLVIPLEAALAFYLSPPRMGLLAWLAASAVTAAVPAVYFSGFGTASFSFAALGITAFALTAFIFLIPERGRHIAVIEQFFLAFIYYRMLGFSRSSEDLAEKSSTLTQGILILLPAAFLLYGIVLYHAAYSRPASKPPKSRDRREIVFFTSGTLLLIISLIVFLPSDFVKSSVITNLLQNEVRPRPVPLDSSGDGFPGGNQQSDRGRLNGGRRFPGGRDGSGSQNRLEGIPSDEWPGTGRSGEGGEGGKQYAVMIVAGKKDPVYLGSSYNGRLHPVRGFLPTEAEVLNTLPRLRLLETWQDTEPPQAENRVEEDLFSLSTLPERYLAYKPVRLEPTILERNYGPFRYSYRSASLMSAGGPKDWADLPNLSTAEKEALSSYLEVPFAKNDLPVFEAHLKGALAGRTGYFEKIVTILKSFSSFQYNLGFTEDTSVQALVDFLTYTREGDCTEFSNASAVLARLAGIPSRVVTGYLAAGDLQTQAHIRGLSILRQAIKPLQDFPLEELFLVTTAHRHSWVQFWLPRYGWIDFETTSFAIPPVGSGDPNNRDVVIPLLQEDTVLSPVPVFPWRPLLRFLAYIFGFTVFAAYGFRYGRLVYFILRSKKCDDKGVRAVYRLLLVRLAADGREVKPPSQTSKEYAAGFPGDPAFKYFADLYTALRYRENFREGEREDLHTKLLLEGRAVYRQLRRPGPLPFIRRIFSLKGLGYQW